MRGLFTDVRTAARSLSRAPTVALSAVLCLALGTGATTAISSAISRGLLQKPPFRDPERLVAIHRVTPNSGPLGTWPHSPANYVDLAQAARQVEGLSALWQFGSALVHLQSDVFQASRVRVSGTLFPMLGVAQARGRMIGPEDDRSESPAVVVLSDEFWHAKLGADAAAIGKTLAIDGQPATIIGITPPGFRIPHGGGMFRADLWMPLRFTPQQRSQRGSNFLQVIGGSRPVRRSSPQNRKCGHTSIGWSRRIRA